MFKPILRKIFDRAFALLPTFLHTGVLKSYANMPELSLKSGFRCFPQIFCSPLVNPAEVNKELLGKKRDLPGIPIDLGQAFELLEQLSRYAGELDWMPRDAKGQVPWSETYTTLDSAILYCMVRHLKPKRFIEVGCGFSSGVSSEAIRRNRAEGHPCEVTFIEPYPGPRLKGINLAGELLVKKIEELPKSFFQSLQAGDILFIDTSHVIKCQNDVEYELLHLLPSLNAGVTIHIHDIYTPCDQPEDWLLTRYPSGYANEQYAVECLLSGGNDYEVLAPLYWLGCDYREKVAAFVGKATDRGQALWIKKVANPR